MKRLFADSDFLVGVFRKDDANHSAAMDWLGKLQTEVVELWTSNLVRQESATVVSHRVGMAAVKLYIKKLALDIAKWVKVDDRLERKAWELFLRQTKKGCSFVDCANLAAIEQYKLDGILTFDEFYPKELRLSQ